MKMFPIVVLKFRLGFTLHLLSSHSTVRPSVCRPIDDGVAPLGYTVFVPTAEKGAVFGNVVRTACSHRALVFLQK